MHNLHTIKKEIRILGLDACKPGSLLGAVLRGGLYLDGVVRLHGAGSLDSRSVSGLVRASRYYPELRVIMIHDEKRSIDAQSTEKSTGLPVIQLAAKNRPGFIKHVYVRGVLNLKTSLPNRTIDQIVSLTWTYGNMPEPLRIAHLLSDSLRLGRGVMVRQGSR